MMSSSIKKPHAVCVPIPAQGHLNPMLKLAKLLHHTGFHITFVNTQYNHKRLLRSRGPNSLDGLPDFRFETIPDGLPPSDADSTQDVPSLCDSTSKNCLAPLCDLISKLNSTSGGGVADALPPVTCVVADGCMSFAIKAAEKFGIPVVIFWTPSACGTLAYAHYSRLVELGYTPLKDTSCLTNGYLETTIDWIPGMEGIRLRDLPSFIRTTDPNDIMLNFMANEAENMCKASAVVINTFDALERDALKVLSEMNIRVYSIGPLHLLIDHLIRDDDRIHSIGSNLWREEEKCIEWLNTKEPNSVVYVSYGCVTVMTAEQLIEFAWGLANSKKSFLWIIRPDLVQGEAAMLPEEFIAETKERGMLADWCQQEEVLKHPAIGGFLTHSGWNSTLESLCSGVPVLCWPFFAEQHTNCKYCCSDWGIGMGIGNNVRREELEKLVRELIDGEKGKEMKKKSMEWKVKAEEAVHPGGSSFKNFERLLKEVLSLKD